MLFIVICANKRYQCTADHLHKLIINTCDIYFLALNAYPILADIINIFIF